MEHHETEPEAQAGTPVSKATKPKAKSLPTSIKKIPAPPAAPTVAVPQTIQGTSAVKKNAQTNAASQSQELSAPKPVVPKTSYAKRAAQDLADSALVDPDNMLSELKELNPDAVEVKIIGIEEQ